ncbi:phosphate ABC transporter substrate-binding protein PstS [Sporolactobacillus terrae]|uniref:Phosphate-binding protein n=1 Tax=Sporolactobacillus terrae TaxID=269673 RepID=A0A5K7WTD0_9BACL|nr:phosphate ABC transporter substrate-binding protein PstS [Sporolactobacillus terrae]BBN97597.1 phosphate-binding protein [Sporolactobacillus terrae]
MLPFGKKVFGVTAALLLAVGVVSGCASQPVNSGNTSSSGSATTSGNSKLVGAGSTFVNPFFSKAFYQYGQDHNLQINYQSIGSGGGIQQFTAKTIDFGASDVPMNAEELKAANKAGGEVVQIPVALGAEAISYNLPGVKSLKLTPATLANIYLGKITKWNDAAIKDVNPGVNLPNQNITTVHRSDGSGTTYIFSDYLSSISKDWETTVGRGKALKWPAGIGGKGNEGVAGQILKTPYTIGYVELAYANQTKMPVASLQNKNGKFVMPTLDGATAAAASRPNVDYKNFSIVNSSGDTSYPIAGYTWALLFKNPSDANKGKQMVDLFNWITSSNGQSIAKTLYYAPLPKNVADSAKTLLQSIKVK